VKAKVLWTDLDRRMIFKQKRKLKKKTSFIKNTIKPYKTGNLTQTGTFFVVALTEKHNLASLLEIFHRPA
jgi:hypothetical protein